jgi:hypothetical protein
VKEKNPIPVHAARSIAEQYGYDQVIIIARRVRDDDSGGEHCTTYGRNAAHCEVAAHCGDFLKHEVMKWHREPPAPLADGNGSPDMKMIYGQCLEGLRVNHDCAATFALAAIMTEVMPAPVGEPT